MIHNVKRKKTPQELIDKKHKQDAPKIVEFHNLVDQCFANRKASKNDMEALSITTHLLELNPENYVFWNIRREIFENGVLKSLESSTESQDQQEKDGKEDKVQDEQQQKQKRKQELLAKEMYFVLSQLKRFPKAYPLWNHRNWCINKMPESEWQNELALIDYMLSKDPRNFHGWHYRRVIVSKLEGLMKNKNASNTAAVTDKEDAKDVNGAHTDTMTQHEFEYTTKKINNDFSNFSAWYNRALLIPKYLSEKDGKEENRSEFLKQEIEYLRQAVYTDPEVSSAWFYHKWLYNNLDTIDQGISDEEKQKLIQEEITMVEELAEVEPDNSYCLIALVYLRDFCYQAGKIEEDAEDQKRRVEVYERLQEIDPLRKRMYQAWKTSYLKDQASFKKN